VPEEVDLNKLKARYYGLKSAITRKGRRVKDMLERKGIRGGAILIPGEDDDIIEEIEDIFDLMSEADRVEREIKKYEKGGQ